MSSESALAQASMLLSYLLRTATVYLLLSLLSRFIRNSHIRFWLQGLFLGTAVTAWLWLLLSFSLPGLVFRYGSASDSLASRHLLSWSVNSATLPHFAKGLSLAFWCYTVIVLLLLTRFWEHSWRLGNFLRASQPAPDALAFLFELVRSGTGSPPCELRLVDGLRSPATAAWRSPKVLLPANLLTRLRAQQLVHVLQHELTHVRRRDYLWDRLSTIGCYLIFFHPAAWLARRKLRWDRELVCDESVVPSSVEGRLEYASCLTTLAAWWFLQETPVGPVDFLSPRSSLLAARVRALLAKPALYGPGRKIALTMMAACSLMLSALSVPRVVVLSYQAPDVAMADTHSSTSSHGAAPHARAHLARRATTSVPLIPPIRRQVSPAPDLNFLVVLPTLSPAAGDSRPFESGESDSFVSSSTNADSGEYSSSPVWDESLPRPSRKRASKIGAVALHVLRVGIAIAATQIGDHEHEKEH